MSSGLSRLRRTYQRMNDNAAGGGELVGPILGIHAAAPKSARVLRVLVGHGGYDGEPLERRRGQGTCSLPDRYSKRLLRAGGGRHDDGAPGDFSGPNRIGSRPG